MDSHGSPASDAAGEPPPPPQPPPTPSDASAMRPPDTIRPYIAPPVRRRRRSDWLVLVIALVVSGLVMVGVCVAGFALYVKNGGSFK